MNIRLRFKLIALLIVLSLAGLLVFQGYWLKGLYDTLYKQMEINIEEAMKIQPMPPRTASTSTPTSQTAASACHGVSRAYQEIGRASCRERVCKQV